MKNGLALSISLVLGVLGFAAMYVVMNRQAEKATEEGPRLLTRILVAKNDLRAGTKLDANQIEAIDIPSEYCSSLHLNESHMANAVGRILRAPVRQGDPILAPILESQFEVGSSEVENQLQGPDCLAVSIELDAASSLAGLVKPGQKVDVIGTFDFENKYIIPPSTRKDGSKISEKTETVRETKTFLLMQARTVVAVDVRTHSRYGGDPLETTGHVVTLAVTPEEAMKVAVLKAKGLGQLALREKTNSRHLNLPPVSAEDLFRLASNR